MKQTIKMKLGIKIFGIAIVFFSTAISLLGVFDKGYDITERICITIVSATIGIIWLIWLIYLLLYKIEIYDGYFFKVRVFFETRIFSFIDITNVIYKRVAFGDYTYVVKFKNGKMEVSPLLKDKYIIDKKLDDNGVFEKYPRVNF